jgi:hypothetical protein
MSKRQSGYKTVIDRYHDALDDALDRPIAVNPAFLKMITAWISEKAEKEGKRYGNSGAPAAAIFLSQAWYWSKRTSDPDGWFYKSQVDWEDETGLTESTQYTCRRMLGLNGMGILEEKLRRVPATVHYKVCRPKVYQLLGLQFPVPQETEIPVPQETSIPSHRDLVPTPTGNLNTGITTEITQMNTLSSPETIFERICEIVVPELKGNGKTYLQAARPVSFENSVLTLTCLDETARGWLESRMTSTINRAFPGFGLDASVRFVVGEAVEA